MQWIIGIVFCFRCIIAKKYDDLPLQLKENDFPIREESQASPSFKPTTATPIKATRYPTAFPTPLFTPPAGSPTYEPTNPKITEISCRQAIQGLNLSIASSMSFQTAFTMTIAYVTSVDPHGVDIAPVGEYNFVCTISNGGGGGCHVIMAYTVVAVNIPTTILGGRLNSAIASGVFNNTLWANTGMTTISANSAVSLVDISPTMSPTAHPSPYPTTFSPSQSTLSQFGNLAEIVGITVGVIVGIAMIIVIYLCCCRKGEHFMEEKRSQRIVAGGRHDDIGDQESKSRLPDGEISPDTISVLDHPLSTSRTINGDKEKDNGYTRHPHVVVDLAGHIIMEGEEKQEDKKKIPILSRDWSIQSIRSSQFLSSFRSDSIQWSISSRRDSHQHSSKSPYHTSSRQEKEKGSHQPTPPPKTSVYEIFRRGSSAYLNSSPDRRDNLSHQQHSDNNVSLFHQSPDPQRSSPHQHPPLEF